MSGDQPITVTVSSTVLPNREAEYESLVRAFIPKALTFPGHLGIHVLKPGEGGARDFHFTIQFASREQMELFNKWPDFLQFQSTIEPLQERSPTFKEMTGLETWFTLPGASVLRPLPRWKMLLVTFVGVYPTSMLINALVGPFVETWPRPLQGLVFSLLMLTLLTFLVMPLLTRCLALWLYPAKDKTPVSKGDGGGTATPVSTSKGGPS